MIELILAFLLSLLPGHYHTTTNDNSTTTVTTMDDVGGDTGQTPPKLPTKP